MQRSTAPTERTSSRVLAATAAAGALVLLSACSPTTDTSEGETAAESAFEIVTDTPDPVGDIDGFTWSLLAEPSSLAYTYAYDYSPNTVLSNVCDTLLRWGNDLTIEPGLATSWTNPTPTTWVYQLREDVVFHDGTPMTADDAVASISRHLDPEVGSFWGGLMSSVASVEKTGEYEITITTTAPNALIHEYLAATPGTVESAATLEELGSTYGTPEGGVNCSGPFAVGEWNVGDSIVLERFDDYWDEDLRAYAEEVTFVFQADSASRSSAWQTGEVDGGWQVPSDAIANLNASGAGAVHFGESTAVTSEIVNNLDGPLGSPEVRQALLMAIDREGLVSAAEYGYAEVVDVLAPNSVWGEASEDALSVAFDDINHYEYDPKTAADMAETAGVVGESIVIATSNVSSATSTMSQAVADAAETIGLEVELRTIAPAEYAQIFSSPENREGIDLFFTFWYLSAGDPMSMYIACRPECSRTTVDGRTMSSMGSSQKPWQPATQPTAA